MIQEAQIPAKAGVMESITYTAVGLNKALEESSEKSGVLFDPEVVGACLRLFGALSGSKDEQYISDQCLKYGVH